MSLDPDHDTHPSMDGHTDLGQPDRVLGLTGIDKSKVSRICKELDEVVEQFRNRPLEGEYPNL